MNDVQHKRLLELQHFYSLLSFEDTPQGVVAVTINDFHKFIITEDGTVKEMPDPIICAQCKHSFEPKSELS